TLAVAGGVTGVLVSLVVFPLLSLMIPDTLPISSLPSLNLRLLSLAMLFTLLTGLGFGVIPAIYASRRATSGVLRSGRWGGPRQLSRSVMVVIEVAASVVLLVSAGLLLRAMLRVQATDPGFRNDGVLILRTVLPKLKYPNVDK